MATVYLATDLRLERRVAIKIMHDHLAEDSAFKERFIQEARSAARLAHPNVVNVFDQGQDSDMAYLVMEYLPGINLRDLLREHGRLTTEQTLDVLEAVLSGLSAAHKAGIVHRDLKPENVMLADDGRIKIGDFGLARAVSANTATGAALLGTIAYLSPELVTRGIADARSDIYAVGIMMYEMLTGEQPYKGEQPMQIAYQHANDSVPTPSTKNSRVPAELDELVLWATARNPEERPKDARVMLDQLMETQSLLATALPTGAPTVQRTMVLPTAMGAAPPSNSATVVLNPAAPPAPAPSPAADSPKTNELATVAKKRRGRGWWLFVLVLLLAGLAGGTGWYFGSGPGSQLTVPDVSQLSFDDASARLIDEGFAVNPAPGQVHHPTIVNDLVVATDPATGSVADKGGSVTLLLSIGPEQLPAPTLAGLSEEAAVQAIVNNRFTVSAEAAIRQFDGDIPAGIVIAALDEAGNELAAETLYSDQRPIRLIVSAGALPEVYDLSVDAATAALSEVGLLTETGAEQYDEEVAEGNVIAIDTSGNANGIVRQNDTVLLTLSRGPAPVVIPVLQDETRDDAIAILEELGLNASYNPMFSLFSDATVTGTNPEPGTSVARGTTVNLFLQLFG
ncbi:serine/threonine-protein kinase [Glaciihabitans tibetensis]|uniref:non-specific serine/threonine protein kinase n=2 Tax=Glaciihabitans tibetensis TaxID=1266600 RepID=A0A2T0VEH4_9MICO|nr:serine/threonine-protein kinase [Glaciihabitans tibetensis]